MMLLTKAIEKRLPALYANEDHGIDDPVVVCKFFTPDSNWTWYATEYDPEERLFFGLVDGFVKEWGYFSLTDLETAKGPMGLPIERDRHWQTIPASEIK